MVRTKNLTIFRGSFTAISYSELGIHTFIIGSNTIKTTTIELLKNVTYMTLNFPIAIIIRKYQ